MLLRSNIRQVLGRLKRYQAGLPEALAKACRPEYWQPRLEQVALVTLRAQWALERNVQTRALYERLTPLLVKAVTAEILPGGSRFTLALPSDRLGSGMVDPQAAGEYHQAQQTPTGRRKMYAVTEAAEEANLQQTRQAILDWVMLEKNRTAQDAGLTDEEIAARIEQILGVHETWSAPKDRTPAMQEAAVRLSAAIQTWLAGEGESPPTERASAPLPGRQGIEPAVAEAWLAAVMAAWKAFVTAHLRARVEIELDRLRNRVRTELL